MHARPNLTLRTFMRRIALFALPGLVLTACDAGAQRERPGAAASGGDYRLTMPALQKVLPVLNAPGVKTECRRDRDTPRDVAAMSVAEMEQQLDRCAPARRAADTAGVSIHEAAQVFKAFYLAAQRITEEESAKVSGGTPAPLPPGALRDNVALIRQHEAELASLTRRSDAQ